MYCKNYGNELRDGDEFCSKCGCKISRDVQDNSTLSTTTDTKLHTIKKFFTYLIIFSTFILLVYGIFTPPNFSIIDFIEDPSGFTSVIAEAFGSGLAMLIFILPLLYGMKKVNIIKKTYKIEAFFILMVIFEIGNWTVGKTFFARKILGSIVLPVLIIGGLMLTYSRFKKK